METATDVTGAIRNALTRFAEAYEAKDVGRVLRAFAPGSDVQLIGTGADEIRLGLNAVREQAERDFAQADRMSISFGELRVDSVNDVAWALAPCAVEVAVGEESISMDLRLTAVFERRADAWLIRQVHLSAAMAGQEAGESFPTT
jgi:ketosteroid isomerase-like protein